jgi:hypothetical protein
MNDRPIWVTVLVGVLWVIAACLPIYLHSVMEPTFPRHPDAPPVDLRTLFAPQPSRQVCRPRFRVFSQGQIRTPATAGNLMPNGGSDNCGMCWFSARNKGEACLTPEASGPDHCTIRDVAIECPLWTYCNNHPKHRSERDRVPIGPVWVCGDDIRSYARCSIPRLTPRGFGSIFCSCCARLKRRRCSSTARSTRMRWWFGNWASFVNPEPSPSWNGSQRSSRLKRPLVNLGLVPGS